MDFSKIKKWMAKMQFILDAYAEDEAITQTEKGLLLDYCKKIEQQIRSLPTLEELQEAAAATSTENPTAEYAAIGQSEGRRETISANAANSPWHPRAATPDQALQAKYDEIFDTKSGKELFDKLESLPITDIKKAMGLNERILTQNELFGGDAQTFDQTIEYLNRCGSMDAAREYLIKNVIHKFDWTHESRIKKAQVFVKLIRRRY